ncbi:MAG TPA: polysaccharide deacetylase family protein [Firmicutes bacterium]|nr:polysaccharide deacetylase family protein [Bacillota bacterium]
MLTPRRPGLSRVPYFALALLLVVLTSLALTQGWGFRSPGVAAPGQPVSPPGEPVSAPGEGAAGDGTTPPKDPGTTPAGTEAGPPAPVRAQGIYLTSHVAGIPDRFGALVTHVENTGLNAMVIDLKDNSGTVPCTLGIPLLEQVGAVKPRIDDLAGLLSSLKAKGIYPIARIVVFQDPVLAKAKPEWAIRDHQGNPWRDRDGKYWLNPYCPEVWDYHLALAEAAVRLGFAEVQFDYVRFPDNPQRVAREAVLDNPRNLSRSEAITSFLRLVKDKIQGKAFLAADVFGLTTTTLDDMGIGQDFTAICQVVDYICPMVYPSHYYNRGIYGLPVPEADPYQVVKRALQDAKAKARGTRAIIRPWLQDFSLRIHYGRAEIEAQIKAAHEEGVDEWLLWNPANVYTKDVDYRVGAAGGTPGNELGRPLILEYHRIEPEEGRWARTPEHFHQDLERLYREGYRLVPLTDYLRGRIDLPAGLSPVILTFDDSSPGQFRLLEAGQTPPPPPKRNGPPPNPLKVGERYIDPDCAVGVLLDFAAQHPDFGRAATFYVLFPTPFGQADCWQEKLKFLVDVGMEIGNHTYSHASLKDLKGPDIQKELALPQRKVAEVIPGYQLRSLALPFGEGPRKEADKALLMHGEHEGTAYHHLGVVLVGAEPAPSWASRNFRPQAIPRVQAIPEELDKWLSYLASHPDDRYVSDGNPRTLSYPPQLQERVRPGLVTQ